jgi:hypothetical protein
MESNPWWPRLTMRHAHRFSTCRSGRMISLAQFCKCYPESFEKKIPEKSSVVAPIMSALYSRRREQASAPCELNSRDAVHPQRHIVRGQNGRCILPSSHPSASPIAAASGSAQGDAQWVTCGRRPGKNFLTFVQQWSGAVTCPAC